MVTSLRIDLGRAKVVTTRELSRDTASVVETVVSQGNPAVITKHGRMIAVLVNLGVVPESQLLTSKAAEGFVASLTHPDEKVAVGVEADDLLNQINAGHVTEAEPRVITEGNIPRATLVSMRRLNQQTSEVLNEVRDSSQPAIVSRRGRLLAALLPLPPHVESWLLSSAAARGWTTTLGKDVRDGVAPGLEVDLVEAHIDLEHREA